MPDDLRENPKPWKVMRRLFAESSTFPRWRLLPHHVDEMREAMGCRACAGTGMIVTGHHFYYYPSGATPIIAACPVCQEAKHA